MKTTRRRIMGTILVVAFLLSMGVGPAFGQVEVKVNINKANVEELSSLKRIGPSYAQRIIDYRNENGPFQKPEDIMNVRGIGISTYEANKDVIVCE